MRAGVLFREMKDKHVVIEVFEIERHNGLSRVGIVSISGVDQKFHEGVENEIPEWVPMEDVQWLDEAPELTPTDPTLTLSPDLEKLFYHEYQPPRRTWSGTYRGITFEVQCWEWSHKVTDIASSLSQPNWNGYIFLNLEKIPPKYGPSSFWLEAKPWNWGSLAYGREQPKTGDETVDQLSDSLTRLAKQMTRSDVKSGRKSYAYTEHPILQAIEFHCGITYYERAYDDGDRMIKIGCDWQHFCDTMTDGQPVASYHPLPITVNMVIEDLQGAIDSFLKKVPEYGK
jgi:hypothetical protein